MFFSYLLAFCNNSRETWVIMSMTSFWTRLSDGFPDPQQIRLVRTTILYQAFMGNVSLMITIIQWCLDMMLTFNDLQL